MLKLTFRIYLGKEYLYSPTARTAGSSGEYFSRRPMQSKYSDLNMSYSKLTRFLLSYWLQLVKPTIFMLSIGQN